ncbi:cobyric acid synthase [Tepidibacillus sp. LV47]|uniref:cobyric acid synthase n=1 Tax=Tepidibacillus sp. LV47 TaxID=3398228 RepID=UPI003AAE16F1
MAKALMIVGTGSDVGKSRIVTALCRYFSQRNVSVAPFKAQNMALNSYITVDGKEIGRAQGLQADAAGIVASEHMNPILLKPSNPYASQVIVRGKPIAQMNFREYRETKHEELKKVVQESLAKLQAEYDLIIIEGAGSPVEMNLKDRDIVNMKVAEWANADVILVADIDRGGVFAQIVGTLQLLTEEERKRVKGIFINKFRGDLQLFQSGIEWIEKYTGIPVLAVFPFHPLPEWEEEDSVALQQKPKEKENADLDIVVVKYPYISNYTDFIPLELEEDVQIRYINDVKEFGNPHVVILPGTKNTMEDLQFLKRSGFQQKILDHVAQNRELVGICGGYQMLGEKLLDPELIESNVLSREGLAFFPMVTRFEKEKKTIRVKGETVHSKLPIFGYEIHMGMVEWTEKQEGMFLLENGTLEGFHHPNLPVWGTFIHGIFDSDHFRHEWLERLREKYGLPPRKDRVSFSKRKEEMFANLEEWFIHSLRKEHIQFFDNDMIFQNI